MDPHLALQALLQGGNVRATLFPATSRYHGIDTGILVREGKEIIYVKRRFLPSPSNFSDLQEHKVTDGDRIDRITSCYYSDPELFWRICDANNAMHPDDLTSTPGKRLRITLPEGIPGGTYA